jgi:phosphoglycolate phosphatase
VFDKDGTLIDFDAMWAGWIEQLARGLEAATRRAVAEALYASMGYDPAARRALPRLPLAVGTMTELRGLAEATLGRLGIPAPEAEAAVVWAWHAPDPVKLAVPLADLRRLFAGLRARGLKIAVATTDDRLPTCETMEALGVAPFVDALACGDDGVPVKPAPDMLLAACLAVGVEPGQAVMVGDSVADMQMARAAGAGLAVGVLSGVSVAADLSPFADVVITSVSDLLRP